MKTDYTLYIYTVKATLLMQRFGTAVAAAYLKTRGVSVEQAAIILATKGN